MTNFWENKKVLVTGGAGFIGFHVAKELIKRNSKVKIVVSPKTNSEHLKRVFGSLLDKITIEKLDLLVFNSFLKATKNQEIVLNFAAMDGGAKFKLEHSAGIFRVNTQLVLNLLESCRINKVGRVLIMSSIDIYPKNVKSSIKEEDAHLNNFDESLNGYALSKRFSEIAAKLYYEQYNLKVAIARVGNVYGLNDFKGIERERVIPTFINKAIKNEDIIIWSNGLKKKSFLYVTDLVEALLNLTEKYSICDPLNIASSEYLSLKELGELIIELSKSKSKIIFQKIKNKKNTNKIINTNKAKKNINFRERIPLSTGLKNIINESYL